LSSLVAILGGGQLGRMLAQSGQQQLELRFRVLDPSADTCAAEFAEHVKAGFDDESAFEALTEGAAAVTYEWENVPLAAAQAVAKRVPVFFPPLKALELAQDRLTQKEFVRKLGLATAPFKPVGSRKDLDDAAAALGLPAVLKTRREGYDGKGQAVIRAISDLDAAWTKLGPSASSPGLILESFVAFEREVSIIAVRGRNGQTAFYPVGENEHSEGILRVTRVPISAPDDEVDKLQSVAEEAARKLLAALEYVGVLTIEFFQVKGRELWINELATRVHNSGHWTQDGAEASQFENHLRAGLGLPLGSTAMIRPIAMVNLIGDLSELPGLKAIPGARVHLYGKEPRPGRKLGHVNVPLEELPP
jgi:5-(carboxyamino)imidazole ribonucleotide synthase